MILNIYIYIYDVNFRSLKELRFKKFNYLVRITLQWRNYAAAFCKSHLCTEYAKYNVRHFFGYITNM